MPQSKAMALLPELNDEKRIDGAVEKILKAIEKNEATLLGYPMVETMSGSRATAENIIEERYPTEFEPPQIPGTFTSPGANSVLLTPDPKVVEKEELFSAVATAFETRNVGATLEVEPTVSHTGEWIDITLAPQRVKLRDYKRFESGKVGGIKVFVEQPQFFTSKVTTSVRLRNGQHRLLLVHKLPEKDDPIEFFILHAEAFSVR